MENTAKKVAVIMGSDSDLPVVKPAIDKLKSFGVPVEAHVMSAHRTPALASEFAANAKANGFVRHRDAARDVPQIRQTRDGSPYRRQYLIP